MINVIPRPARVTELDGAFEIGPDTPILFDSAQEGACEAAMLLADLLGEAAGKALNVRPATDASHTAHAITLTAFDADQALGGEGYTLTVHHDSVVIRAISAVGLFYGVQTLRQLITPQNRSDSPENGSACNIQCGEIIDKPRFPWRGLMLDTARHFFPKEFVLKFIDVMALHKLNHLHLHLVDDQGWRLEIDKYPILTQRGACRNASGPDDELPTGPAHGGFYTKDAMREIIAHATSRHITIVPEIEMPGHVQSVLACDASLSCRGEQLEVLTTWGINKNVYCAGNEDVFTFLENVLTEVAELFPGPYIHAGGDECPKDRWREFPKCQARIKTEGLADEDELQSYFIRRIEAFLATLGKKLIGWDEILEGGLSPEATLMSWRGTRGGILAAKAGHDVVMCPTSHCYFDYRQAETGEPKALGQAVLPLETVYSFEPIPDELDNEAAARILGVQGNLWTEYMDNSDHVEYMTYPRATALAEVAWTPAELKNTDEFKQRLNSLGASLGPDFLG